MTELERPRSYKDERDGDAGDCVLAAQKSSVEGRAGIALFRAGRKILADGRSVRGKGVSQGWSDLWQHWRCALGGVRTRDETPRGKMTPRGKAFWIWKAFFVCARCAILDGERSGYG